MGEPDADAGLDRLFADGAAVAAARVFAEVFAPGAKAVQSFKEVRAKVAALGGLTQRTRFLTTTAMAEPTYAVGLEIVLRWEHAYLAARIPVDSQGLHVVLLREGRSAQQAPDPYAAALAALRTSGRD
ncbi:hypothetical protein [Nocardioides nitrophenolicus]|uniref:hypothetical protein n=1 Tax=Nocardioides nitrophenolicus TaxID=60489 RepID=UPI00195CA14A|nr:hypothetical protein [Nocardioides nitrophenolicus]MBM7517285.1 hypothetical protein [Nocardioides nitrophenolicus]